MTAATGSGPTPALSLMPDAFNRLLAFPNGIAMIGLGWSLWASTRPAARPAVVGAPLTPATVE